MPISYSYDFSMFLLTNTSKHWILSSISILYALLEYFVVVVESNWFHCMSTIFILFHLLISYYQFNVILYFWIHITIRITHLVDLGLIIKYISNQILYCFFFFWFHVCIFIYLSIAQMKQFTVVWPLWTCSKAKKSCKWKVFVVRRCYSLTATNFLYFPYIY